MCSGQVFAILAMLIMQSRGRPQSTTVEVLLALKENKTKFLNKEKKKKKEETNFEFFLFVCFDFLICSNF